MSFSSFSLPLFFSLFGFYSGNIFPTTFVFFQGFLPWSHSLGLALILWNELLGFLFFRCGFLTLDGLRASNSNAPLGLTGEGTPAKLPGQNELPRFARKRAERWSSQSPKVRFQIPRWTTLRSIKEPNRIRKLTFYLRCFQFGLLFGIFVDAFKVGS